MKNRLHRTGQSEMRLLLSVRQLRLTGCAKECCPVRKYPLRKESVRIESLLRGEVVEDGGDDDVDEVGEPEGEAGGEGAGEDEHLAELQEKDVEERQADAEGDVEAYAAALLAAREGHGHDGEDEGGEGERHAAVLLDLGVHHVRVTSHLLGVDEGVEVFLRQGLHRLLVAVEVAQFQGDDRVDGIAAAHVVLEPLGVVADEVAAQVPSVEGAVPGGGLGRQLGDQLVVFDALQGELVGGVVVGAERLHVDELPRGNLVVDVVAAVFGVVLVHVFGLELHPGRIGARDYEEVEPQGEQRDQRRGDQVRHHHAVVADASGKDCYDLRVRGQAGGEENHRDEHEQRGEHINEVGDEIDVVVEYDGLQRHLVLHEVLYLLRNVEYYDDANDDEERYEEGHDELLHDVAVQYFRLQKHYNRWLKRLTA